MLTMLRFTMLLLVILVPPSGVIGGEVLYSYRGDGVGGLAKVVADEQTGRIISHTRLIEDARLGSAHKIGIDQDRQLAIVVNSSKGHAGAWVVDLRGQEDAVFVPLTAEPDAVCISAGAAHIGLDDGQIVTLDLDTRTVIASFQPRSQLTPPGHKPESMYAVPSRGVVLVSFQKDHRGGVRLGNRIMVLRERTLELIADVQLPRSLPQAHNTASPKEQGPGPEVISVCERTGSVLVTLDLYGAVLPMRLDELISGRVTAPVYLSAALDGSFGYSFPDRLVTLGADKSHLTLILNSGAAGGGVLVDYAAGQIVHRFSVPHGLEPVEPGTSGRVFAAHAGKLKLRAKPEVEKQYLPRRLLTELVIEANGVRAVDHEAPMPTHLAARTDVRGSHLLVVMGIERDRLGVFTPDAGFDPMIHQAFGPIERVVTLPVPADSYSSDGL